jgi:hypothetical protein
VWGARIGIMPVGLKTAVRIRRLPQIGQAQDDPEWNYPIVEKVGGLQRQASRAKS